MGRTFSETVAETILLAKKKTGMTDEQIARRARISRSTFYRKMKAPESFTAREIGSISKVLKISWETR